MGIGRCRCGKVLSSECECRADYGSLVSWDYDWDFVAHILFFLFLLSAFTLLFVSVKLCDFGVSFLSPVSVEKSSISYHEQDLMSDLHIATSHDVTFLSNRYA